jgi:TIR domain
VDLAERLSGDGVVVILDKWDLREGQDKHAFMEQLVKDKSIMKVLVICDAVYQAKADGRSGGVGTETQLISKEVYENTDQEKFIPIVREHDREGAPCVPKYMASRLYIDLSSPEIFEANYQKLVRNLYGKPLIKRPPLGIAPAYITEESQIVLRTSHKVSEIKNALLNGRPSANGLISDFLDTFLLSLEDFRLSDGTEPNFDERVAAMIEKMLPLRDEFIDFALTVFRYQDKVDLRKLQDFFERLVAFGDRPQTVTRYTEIDYDNYKFFIYELTLNFLAVLLSLMKYEEFAYFVGSPYFYRHPISGELESKGIEILNRYVLSLDKVRNARLRLQRVSVTADLIKSHSTRRDLNFEAIQQVDLILHYVTELCGLGQSWFPRTSVYSTRGSGTELLDRMVSLQHFERIKGIFQVNTVDELKVMVAKYVELSRNRRGYAEWEYNIRPLEKVIDPAKIGRLK